MLRRIAVDSSRRQQQQQQQQWGRMALPSAPAQLRRPEVRTRLLGPRSQTVVATWSRMTTMSGSTCHEEGASTTRTPIHLHFSTLAPVRSLFLMTTMTMTPAAVGGAMPFTTATMHSRGDVVVGAMTSTSEDSNHTNNNNNNSDNNNLESDDTDDDNDDDDDSEQPIVDAKSIKSSKLKKLYKGKLKKILLDDHGITVDSKSLNWIIPWKMAVLIHCLETKQDYSIVMKRPGPTRNEIGKHLDDHGIRDTKENRLRARLEMKRANKIKAKQLLLKVMIERGHVMKHAPSKKSEWQDLYIRIQEMIVHTSSTQVDGATMIPAAGAAADDDER
jgi:hypothetical protein